VDVNTASARDRLGDSGATQPGGGRVPPYRDDEFDTVLVIGTDFAEETPDRQEGVFADAILLWIVPTDGSSPAIVSIPRDLMIVDPCTGEGTKLDRTLEGCGDEVSGPQLVAIAVEDYTGIHVDHFATIDFTSFVDVIDAMGGIQICVDHALRQITDLPPGASTEGDETDYAFLPAGCTNASGKIALHWVRSRGTQEFVDGGWRFIEGVSDVNRTVRQQTLLFTMLAKLKTMRSPSTLAGIVESVGDGLVLDNGLSMSDALKMAWDLRSIPADQIRRIVVPTEPVTTEDGSFAVRATVPFWELFDR